VNYYIDPSFCFGLKTKKYEKNGIGYNIINYLKNEQKNEQEPLLMKQFIGDVRQYRSVIMSDPENKILCFSPPKSINYDEFKNKYPEINNRIFTNEIIEGTMINLFYDKRINKWEISSKGAVGGQYYYYRNIYDDTVQSHEKQTTFYQMFLDAFRSSETQQLNELPFIESLSKNYSYSFVMQHPDNHIVCKIDEPKLYLVAVYDINDIDNKAIYIPPTVYEQWTIFDSIRGIIDFPKQYDLTTYVQCEDTILSIQNDFNNIGMMLTNIETGERTALKNPAYDEIKKLRGNNPNLQYQYLCLRRMNKVKKFLQYFPQYTMTFSNFYKGFNDFVTNTHSSYVAYYIKKNPEPISKKYFPHIYKIHHTVYLPSLQSEKLIIRRKIVQNYFDAMEPRDLIYHLNYDKRQNM